MVEICQISRSRLQPVLQHKAGSLSAQLSLRLIHDHRDACHSAIAIIH